MAKKKSKNKVQKVMKEFAAGELHSGSKKGPRVTNRKQAIAIALSEARAAKKAKPKRSSKKSAKKDPKPAKVSVAKGVKVARGKEEKMRKGPGKSSAGAYKNVNPKDFAGPDYTFPINSISRARNALARKHFAKNPAAIERAVYKKYPELKKRKMKREGKKEK